MLSEFDHKYISKIARSAITLLMRQNIDVSRRCLIHQEVPDGTAATDNDDPRVVSTYRWNQFLIKYACADKTLTPENIRQHTIMMPLATLTAGADSPDQSR